MRSSATAEDLADASFAGQQETFLNIHGLDNLLKAVRNVFASLYNDRAISYRVHKGFIHSEVALSVGVQRMVRSDIGASGVMFTLDTESGFDKVVFITASYGLGETVVQGAVNPDEFYVYKPALAQGKTCNSAAQPRFQAHQDAIRRQVMNLAVRWKHWMWMRPSAEQFSITDAEVEELARHAVVIERHYQRPMDIEWGKDGADGKLYILQARPETVQSRARMDTLRRYRLKGKSEMLVSGRAIGQKIGSGPVRLISERQRDVAACGTGDVLVTDMTDPDWEPVMKRASAIVTNRGGRTCHAAIIARELGIPAVVGCGNATSVLTEDQMVTVSCTEGDIGNIYRGVAGN